MSAQKRGGKKKKQRNRWICQTAALSPPHTTPHHPTSPHLPMPIHPGFRGSERCNHNTHTQQKRKRKERKKKKKRTKASRQECGESGSVNGRREREKRRKNKKGMWMNRKAAVCFISFSLFFFFLLAPTFFLFSAEEAQLYKKRRWLFPERERERVVKRVYLKEVRVEYVHQTKKKKKF